MKEVIREGDIWGLFRSMASKEIIEVRITHHAASRLIERKAKEYEKLSPEVLCNIIANTIRDGKCWIGSDGIKIATRKYTLACSIEGGVLVVKTVMRTDEENWKKFMKARPSPWRNVIIVSAPKKVFKAFILSQRDENQSR